MHVIDDEHGIDAVFFLMGRRFMLSRMDGTQTELRLKEDGIWTPDAYPKKAEAARKRKGKRKGVSHKGKKGGKKGGKKQAETAVFE